MRYTIVLTLLLSGCFENKPDLPSIFDYKCSVENLEAVETHLKVCGKVTVTNHYADGRSRDKWETFRHLEASPECYAHAVHSHCTKVGK